MHISTKQMEKLMDGYVQMIKSVNKGIDDYFDDQERKDNLLIEVGELRAENKRLKDENAMLKDEIAKLQIQISAPDKNPNIKFGDE